MEIDILNNQIKNLIADKDYTERQYDSLKKVYNDLAESHAKQVILNNNQSETIGNLYDQIDTLKKESHEWQLLSEHFKAANQVEILESELLKAKELLTRCRKSNGYHTVSLSEDLDEFLDKK